MAKFHVGEVVVGRNLISMPEYNGMEAVILGGPQFVKTVLEGTEEALPRDWCYHVEWADGDRSWQTEFELRKKRPPKESDDVRETREKGAPSFTKMMEDLKKGRVPEVV